MDNEEFKLIWILNGVKFLRLFLHECKFPGFHENYTFPFQMKINGQNLTSKIYVIFSRVSLFPLISFKNRKELLHR